MLWKKIASFRNLCQITRLMQFSSDGSAAAPRNFKKDTALCRTNLMSSLFRRTYFQSLFHCLLQVVLLHVSTYKFANCGFFCLLGVQKDNRFQGSQAAAVRSWQTHIIISVSRARRDDDDAKRVVLTYSTKV